MTVLLELRDYVVEYLVYKICYKNFYRESKSRYSKPWHVQSSLAPPSSPARASIISHLLHEHPLRIPLCRTVCTCTPASKPLRPPLLQRNLCERQGSAIIALPSEPDGEILYLRSDRCRRCHLLQACSRVWELVVVLFCSARVACLREMGVYGTLCQRVARGVLSERAHVACGQVSACGFTSSAVVA